MPSQLHLFTSKLSLRGNIVKSTIVTLVGALTLAATIRPVSAATSLNVPFVATAPVMDTHVAWAFNNGSIASLGWNQSTSRPADEPATVHLLSDGTNLYVRFDVPQREPIVGFLGGDSVGVDIGPNGESGNSYHLSVAPNGWHEPTSSPSTADWQTFGGTYPGGYSVAMAIPLRAIGATTSYHAQFSRWISQTAEEQVWSPVTLTLGATVGQN